MPFSDKLDVFLCFQFPFLKHFLLFLLDQLFSFYFDLPYFFLMLNCFFLQLLFILLLLFYELSELLHFLFCYGGSKVPMEVQVWYWSRSLLVFQPIFLDLHLPQFFLHCTFSIIYFVYSFVSRNLVIILFWIFFIDLQVALCLCDSQVTSLKYRSPFFIFRLTFWWA